MQENNNNSAEKDIEFDVLTEIGNIGAGNATTALSQLINARIDMCVPKVDLLGFSELAEIVGGAETLVAGILLSLEGDVDGMMLFVLESSAAHLLVDQLMGCVSGENKGDFSEMEPYLSVDMAGAILSVPAIEFGKLGDKALLIESKFKDLDVDISGYFILIPTLESYGQILTSLGL